MIPGTTSYAQFIGNGATTAFGLNAKIFAASNLVITLIDTNANIYSFTFVSGVQFSNTALGLTANVSGVDVDSGCTVTFSGPPATGWTVDLRTVTPDTQLTSIKNQGAFLPELHEEAFDNLTRQVQDLRRQAYTFGIHTTDLETASWTALPSAANRINKVLLFDGTGLPTVVDPTTLFSLATYGATVSFFGNRVYAGASAPVNSYMFLPGTSISGVASGAAVGNVISPFNLNIAGDTVDTTTSGTGLLRMLSVVLGVQAGHTGGRSAIYGAVQVVGSPALAASSIGYVGLEGFAFGNANAGGAAGAVTNYKGGVYGINPTARIGPNGTFWSILNGSEFDIAIQFGGSAAHKYGLSIIKQGIDYQRADYADVALTIADQAGYTSASAAIPAGSFVVGRSYVINVPGTTDFTLIGAADSNPGTFFQATGVGTGTGNAIPELPGWLYGHAYGAYDSQWPFDGDSTLNYAWNRQAGVPPAMVAKAMQLNKGYKIVSTGGGSTDFTTLGAVNNTVGTVFIYNGAAVAGTGTVTRGQSVAGVGIDWTNVLFATAAIKTPGFTVGPYGQVTVTGNPNAVGNTLLVTNTFTGSNNYILQLSDVNNTNGSGIKFTGNGGTTPAKTWRCTSGNMELLNNANGLMARFFDAGGLRLTAGLGTNGNNPPAQPTGYGTPTNAAVQGSFDATTITLVNLAKAVAQLILDLKPTGIIAV